METWGGIMSACQRGAAPVRSPTLSLPSCCGCLRSKVVTAADLVPPPNSPARFRPSMKHFARGFTCNGTYSRLIGQTDGFR